MYLRPVRSIEKQLKFERMVESCTTLEQLYTAYRWYQRVYKLSPLNKARNMLCKRAKKLGLPVNKESYDCADFSSLSTEFLEKNGGSRL